MTEVTIDLMEFDFEYWNHNRITILQALIEMKEVGNTKELADRVTLNYASTYNIVKEFEKKKLVIKYHKRVKLVDDWEKIFKQRGLRPYIAEPSKGSHTGS